MDQFVNEASAPGSCASRRLDHRRVSTTLDKYAHAVPGGDAQAAATLWHVMQDSGWPSGCRRVVQRLAARPARPDQAHRRRVRSTGTAGSSSDASSGTTPSTGPHPRRGPGGNRDYRALASTNDPAIQDMGHAILGCWYRMLRMLRAATTGPRVRAGKLRVVRHERCDEVPARSASRRLAELELLDWSRFAGSAPRCSG